MVWQERYYAEAKDIISIRLTCKKCEGGANIPFGGKDYFPETCPYCHEGWFVPGSSDLKMLTWFVQSVRAMKQRGNDAQCQIQFELPGDLNVPDDK